MGLTANAGQTPQELKGALNQDSLTVAVAGATPNLAAVGMGYASLLYLSGVASISGIAGGFDGRELTLVSLDGGQTLIDASGLSLPGNRFLLGANLALATPGASCFLRWNAPLTAWVLMSQSASSGGGGGVPSAPLTSVQFNNAGAFGGSADLTWDDAIKVLGVNGFADIVTLQYAFLLNSTAVTDNLAAGDNDDFTPPADASSFYLTPDGGGSNLTGLVLNDPALQTDGFEAWIVNPDAAATLTITNQDAGSSAGNQFQCPGNSDFILIPQSSVKIRYENFGTGQWRVMG